MRYAVRSAALLAAAVLAGCENPGTAVRTEAPTLDQSEARFAGTPTHTGFIFNRDGDVIEVGYEVREGRAVWDGDIDIGAAGEVARTREELTGRRAEDGPNYGVIRDGSNYRWPGGVVPYVVDANLASPSRVTNAIKHVESNTDGVTFKARTTERNYVRFTTSTGCSSSVGMVGGVQYIRLASGCSTGNTIHEILHALGMYHEHTRCDRDTFVQILTANIASGYSGNFTRQCSGASDVFSYNEGSIMHYGPYAFSSNGLPTIVSLRGLDNQMGQRSGMSNVDVQTINSMY